MSTSKFFIATAKASDLDFVEREGRDIEAILSEAGAQHVHHPPDVLTNDNFADRLQDGQYDVVHYAGHAGTGSLHFDGGAAHAAGLVESLRARTSIDLVFLNGCVTLDIAEQLTAESSVARKIPVVIATTTEVDDELAYELANAFYRQLARGETIGDAFDEAERRARSKVDWRQAGRKRRDGKRHVAPMGDATKGGNEPWKIFTAYDKAKDVSLFSKRDASLTQRRGLGKVLAPAALVLVFIVLAATGWYLWMTLVLQGSLVAGPIAAIEKLAQVKLCRAGDGELCNLIGFRTADPAFYRLACDQGSMSGCANLGGSLGRFAEAEPILMAACEGGAAHGCTNLASRFEGQGEIRAAKRWYEAACDMASMRGCYDYARLLYGDLPIKPDEATFTEPLARCETKDTAACFTAAAIQGAQRDPTTAVETFERACHCEPKCRLAYGCFVAAKMYDADMIGVPHNETRAAELLNLACDTGLPKSCYALARKFEHGAGVMRNAERAAQLKKLACDAGYAPACN